MVKIMENPISMDDLGVLLFLETPTSVRQMFDTSLGGGNMFHTLAQSKAAIKNQTFSRWWLQPNGKILVKMGIFPK